MNEQPKRKKSTSTAIKQDNDKRHTIEKGQERRKQVKKRKRKKRKEDPGGESTIPNPPMNFDFEADSETNKTT